MDPTLLGTLISAALVAIYHVLFAGKQPAPATPAPASPVPAPQPAPAALASTAPSPAPQPAASTPIQSPSPAPQPSAASADPFAGLPGLPGHPVLNGLILPFLNTLLAGKQPATTADVQSQAATAALASVIKSDPTTLAQMQSLLAQPAAAK